MIKQSQNLVFDLEFGVTTIRVEEIRIPGQTMFRVNFANQIPSLTLLRASNFNGEKFWTSVPEGRQKLAIEIGPLIENFYRTKMK